ncbi:MAG: 50S ribosomal protein L6 [SAR202 cluster bacterium]|jgi:large subunit ribosomal protein L6|nr:50S ribosomal protein L6 [Chloroflexota bacterium]MDP7613371.1 50S ribosomal protein L6 [Dehalococcoidia bacterium]MQG47021.1 50S ribosomal protein L6 [SAR202 cluster bacterium]|tara:strand:+ start:727 stop:1278 length:552 start_codon:yes stop_codon:yes gene_type:complete
MSRVGTTPIVVPAGVEVSLDGKKVSVKGKLGELSYSFPAMLTCKLTNGVLLVERENDEPKQRSLHGLCRSLINNMVVGVSEGFNKKLELIGTGYRVQKKGKALDINVGYSHQIEIEPQGTNQLEVVGQNVIIISGPDKQCVGDQAARIRKIRKPNPFTGKGIKYDDEVIKRKAGKAAATSAGL